MEDLIVQTPGVCGGEPRIAGHRLTVWFIQAQIRGGATVEYLCDEWDLTPEQVEAAASYGRKGKVRPRVAPRAR